jgi:hypothetical protein
VTRWITEILGFAEAIRFTVPDGGPAGHLELARDGAVLMLGLAGGRFGETASVTLVFVDDVGAACDPIVDSCSGGRCVIAKPFIITKDNCRIGAKILRDNKIIRDHGAFPAAFAKRWRPMVPQRRGLRICRPGAAVWGSESPDGPARPRPATRSPC